MAEDLVLLCSQCNKHVNKVQNEGFYESWSSTQIQIVKLRHTWTISNFSLCCQETGKKLVSPIFSTVSNSEKLAWSISIYPKGDYSAESRDCVSLFLNLVKGNMDGIQANYKCGIVNAKGEIVNIKNASRLFKWENGKPFSWANFISQKCLFDEKNEYLVDDKLTIFCEIIAGVGSRTISGTLATPQSDLGFDFTFQYDNQHLNDVILSAGGKEFPAHKVILSACSPVFRAMFQHDMEESRNNRVKITDIDEEALGEMLRYMYTGRINKLEEMTPRLLSVAEKYELDDLKMICEKALLKILSIENVVEIFILSDKFSATGLKNQVKRFIAAHRAVLGNTPEFKSIFRTHPDLGQEAFCAPNNNSFFSSMAEDLILLCSKCNKIVKEAQNDEFYESWSFTQIQVVKLRHSWTITNFSLCSQEKGEALVSPTFSAGSTSEKLEWYLSIYPKGDFSEKCDDYVSLFLHQVNCNNDGNLVKYKCGIVNAKGQNVYIKNASSLFKSENGWGWFKFIDNKCLFDEKNEYLVDDKLTILCEITTKIGRRNISGTLATPQSDLEFDFTFLYENKHLNDVILFAGGKEFPAHKVILSARSPVFRAMFQHDMEESRNNWVKITDVDEEALGEMLRYMYTGKINKLEEMAPRLIAVAEKYQLDNLKMLCEKALLKILSIENVVEIFILSDKFAATELKNQVKEFIAAHRAVLGNAPEFKSIFRTHPDLGLEAFCALKESASCV